MKRLSQITFSCLLAVTCQVNGAKLNLDIKKVAVSGLSSGGYMANQFHIAHSDWVNKVGIIAAGPYYCAKGSIKIALEQCVNKSSEETGRDLKKQIEIYAKQNKIAPLSHLSNSRVWLFRGSNDNKIHFDVGQALEDQYSSLLSTQEQLSYVTDLPFAHHLPTLNSGSNCELSETPFLGKCQYDAAGVMLNFLHSNLSPRNEQAQGKLIQIDQQELGGSEAKTLADMAYLYIPQSCQKGEACQLHISFHGCQQNSQTIGTQFVENNGLNNWADNNQFVVLYPQTKNSMFMPLNPQGCWDWWGYSGSDYATRSGKQIVAVTKMVNALHKLDL